MKRFLWLGGLVLAGIGIALTLFLTWHHINGNIGAVCGSAGCETVLSSSWANFAGLPTALYGLLFYFAAFLTIGFYPLLSENARTTVLSGIIGLSGLAVVLSLVLTGYSFSALDTLCTYCTTSLGLVTLIFAGAVFWKIRGTRVGEFNSDRPGLWKGLAITSLVFALIGGGFAVHFAQASSEPAQQNDNSLEAIQARVATVDSVAIGSANAPIRVVEFYDLECPACQQFTLNIFPRIKEEFIDTGEVVWTFRSFPIDSAHPHATRAQAALSTIPPSNFLEAKKEIMKNADQWVSAETGDPIPYLESVMKKYGVEWDGYPKSMEKHLLSRRDDYMRMGIRQTPSFLVNGRLVEGGQPFFYWQQLFKKIKQE